MKPGIKVHGSMYFSHVREKQKNENEYLVSHCGGVHEKTVGGFMALVILKT